MMDNCQNIYSKVKKIEVILFFYSFMGFLLIINPTFSQEKHADTSRLSPDSITQYITPLEYAFMMHEETSWLLKANGFLYVGPASGFYYKLGIEKRIASSFTLNLNVYQTIYLSNLGDGPISLGISTSLESRWYYRLNKRIKEKKVARNMSDNYFALGIGYDRYFKNAYENTVDYGDTDPDHITLYIKWGLQRRFLKYGHTDVGVKFGATNSLNNYFSPRLVLNTYVDLGLAYTKDKFKLDPEKLCPVMKCYESTNHIFKSNLSSLFHIHFDKYSRSFNVSPHIAFERKIAASSFSINTELNATYNYMDVFFAGLPERPAFTYLHITGLLEARYYYNLKRRILKGKTGNGLSADYVALGGSYTWSDHNYAILDNNIPQVFLVTGWQRVVSKHMYYDIQLGVDYKGKNSESTIEYSDSQFGSRFKIAVGYRF